MRKLIVQRNKKEHAIEGTRLGDTYILSVGAKCDPSEVQSVLYRYSGIDYSQIIFDIALPENSDTNNNAYLLTRHKTYNYVPVV